eukprot:Plantae.Rhodophyta-Hildenbrandia_rubra.ctg18430.p1 GENE.Plantae.Rhodophyta-Hildenbrandia_rubra.ctg18430~~Plantae.Rhodophyta-Hildenbrandia_rubra.ctg18430.p1  ORF type:complete len:192 (+),score=28.63 Plantae.Rhodophyta-Hildenbrandia_rubra.ctg18430:395-970(+)
MGAQFSACVGGGSSKDRELPCVLLVGLDGSGTTTILYQVKHGKRLETIPTLGLNKENVKFDNLEFELFDVGGLEKVRTLWRTYSKEANGVAYVVDSSDPQRISQASTELKKLFFGDKKKKSLIVPDIPLLILANKTDLPGSMTMDVITRDLELHDLPVRNYKVLPTVATEGKNLREGMTWMVQQLRLYGYR